MYWYVTFRSSNKTYWSLFGSPIECWYYENYGGWISFSYFFNLLPILLELWHICLDHVWICTFPQNVIKFFRYLNLVDVHGTWKIFPTLRWNFRTNILGKWKLIGLFVPLPTFSNHIIDIIISKINRYNFEKIWIMSWCLVSTTSKF